MTGRRERTVSPPVARARDRVDRLARKLGYLVTRDESDGVATLTLFCLDPLHPCVRLIQIVPDHPLGRSAARQRDPLGPELRERIIAHELAIPECVTPSTVGRVLDLLLDIERAAAS